MAAADSFGTVALVEHSVGRRLCRRDVLGFRHRQPIGLHDLRRQQLLEHGGHGGDELHGLSDEQCGVSRRDELLL